MRGRVVLLAKSVPPRAARALGRRAQKRCHRAIHKGCEIERRGIELRLAAILRTKFEGRQDKSFRKAKSFLVG
jgi:hypothetical protein